MLRCYLDQRARYSKKRFKDLSITARAHFHATPRREIVPVIGAAVVAVVVRYSYKALMRMGEEREEYLEELAAYEDKYGPIGEGYSSGGDNSTKSAPLGSLGLDLGSANIRVAYVPSGSSSEPRVIEDREGGRSTPNSILLEEEEIYEHGVSAIGRLAKAKVHERCFRAESEHVLNPWKLLQTKDDRAETATQAVIRSALISAMEKATGKKYSMGKSSPFVFSKDNERLFNLKAVFTYPVGLSTVGGVGDDEFINIYRKALNGLYEDSQNVRMVPEPIATMAAAEHFSLFPKGSDSTNPSLLIDVGADAMVMSLVSKDEVISSSRIPGVGAEILTDALVKHMDDGFQKSISSSVSLLETDGMARQRMYDGAEVAVAELSNMTRTSISLPFLSVDPKSFQPRHLNESFSRGVLSSIVDSMIPARLGQAQKFELLSSSITHPNSLNALIASMAMGLFEQNSTNPFQLRAVIMVGGGSRSPIFQSACREALATLGGEQFVSERLIVPTDEKVEELTVLGAALYGGECK